MTRNCDNDSKNCLRPLHLFRALVSFFLLRGLDKVFLFLIRWYLRSSFRRCLFRNCFTCIFQLLRSLRFIQSAAVVTPRSIRRELQRSRTFFVQHETPPPHLRHYQELYRVECLMVSVFFFWGWRPHGDAFLTSLWHTLRVTSSEFSETEFRLVNHAVTF